jgi:hypothetical protein
MLFSFFVVRLGRMGDYEERGDEAISDLIER